VGVKLSKHTLDSSVAFFLFFKILFCFQDVNEVKIKKFKLNMSDDQRFVDGNAVSTSLYVKKKLVKNTIFEGLMED